MTNSDQPLGMTQLQRRWGVLAGVIAALALLYLLQVVLLPFVVAGGLAILLSPLVRWLIGRLHCRRWIAAAIVFLLFLGVLAGLGFWVKLVVVPDAVGLTQNLPEMLHRIFVAAAGRDQVRIAGRDVTSDSLCTLATEAAVQAAGSPAHAIASLVGTVVMSVMTLTTLCYFLISGPRLARSALWLFPQWLQPEVAVVARAMRPLVFRYVLGILTCVSASTVLCWIGLGLILHFPHALVLALVVALLELLPVIGSVASAILIAVAAVGQGDLSVVIGAGLFTLILRLLVDLLVAPIVFGKAADLHPAVILCTILVCGTLFGMLGLLAAVPAAAMVKLMMQRLREGPVPDAAHTTTAPLSTIYDT